MQMDSLPTSVPPSSPAAAALRDSPPAARAVMLLRPRSGWAPLDLGELWRYRELLFFLALRDIKLRYKQTYLGIAWAIIQPVTTMLVFTLLLGRTFAQSGKIPYSIWTFCALLPWQLFANSLNQAGNSLVSNERLITKVYFPRLLMPMSSVLAGLLDIGIQLVILLGMMFFRREPIVPGWGVLALPVFILLALLAAMSVGLWLSALNVLYRDVRYAIPFLTQIWMVASPVFYPMSVVESHPRWVQVIYSLNPMVGVIEGFHWALLRDAHRPGLPMAVSAAATLVLLIGGMYYFRRMEKSFADVV